MKNKSLNISDMWGVILGAIFLPLFAITSCGDNKSTADRIKDSKTVPAAEVPAPNLIRLVSPDDRQETKIGASVNVEFRHVSEKMPDSVQLWFGGRLLKTLGGEVTSDRIPGEQIVSTGLKPLKLMAYSGSGRPQVVTIFLTVLSDLIPVQYSYSVVKTYPHDNNAYTQGLLFHEGFFYESTGLEGRSTLRKVEVESGKVVIRHDLESKFFGEGLAMIGNKIFQLTWKSKIGFTYDRETFRETGKFRYGTEGWGLTSMGDKLVMSDGSNKLYIVEPATFATISILEVCDDRSVVVNLNELEYIKGEIWANIYLTDLIATIDPSSGKITGYIDLNGIMPDRERRSDGDDALNGIAFDETDDRIFVTGKNWPKLFQIKVMAP
jgi:glutaminyl-peptide cyclotransferase